MTKRMERQRVLYSAKTKTTKVVPTSSTRRPLSLPTSFQTDDLPAPLASIESDVSLITKHDSEFPKSTHISAPTHRPSSLTENRDGKLISSNKDVTIWKRDNSNTELVRSTPSRSTIRIRNSKTCDLPKSHPSYRGYKSHRPRSEGVTDILSSDKATSQRGISSDSDLSTINNNTHQRLQNELGRKVRCASSTTLDRSTEGSRNRLHCGTTIKESGGSYPEKKDVRNAIPPVEPKPKICSKVAATNMVPSRNKLSSTSLLESSPVIIRREGHASTKENHVMSTLCPQDSDKMSKPCGKKVHTFQKLEQQCPQSNHKTASSLTHHSAVPYSSSKFPAKKLLPQMNSPLTYSQNKNGVLPEMYTEMSATTTRDHKIASHFTGQHKEQIAQSKCNRRKPLAAISISSNTPTSSIEDIHVYSDLNITNTEISRNRYQHNDQNILKNTTSSIDKDPTSISHTEHVFSDEFGHFFAGDFKPRWKRNSMRLATQGYASMSDLTESVECLNGCEEVVSISARSPKFYSPMEKLVGKPAEILSQNSLGKMFEIYQPNSERREYPNISNDVSLNMKENNESSIHCDTIDTSIRDEDPVVTLARNGMNRLSYRMATLGVTNAWTQEGDGSEYFHNNNLSPVTERPDGDLRSDTCNLDTELSTGSERYSKMSGAAPNIQPFSSAAIGLDGDGIVHSPASEASSVGQHIKQSDTDQHIKQSDTDQHIKQSDTEEQNEHLNKIKRWSYLLATTASISDLTFLDAGLDLVDSSVQNKNKNSQREVSHCTTAHTQRNKHITEFQHGQTQVSTYYNNSRLVSSTRNSSEINNESYKSAHKTVLPESTNESYLTKQMKETPSRHGQCVLLESSDVDSTDSGNTSCYYSASSDTSFVTADGDPLNSGHSQGSSQWSPGQTSLHQKQRSTSQLHGNQISPRFESQIHASHRLPPKDQNRKSPVQPSEDRRSSNLQSHVVKSYNRPLPDQHPASQRESSQPLSPHDPKVISTNNKQCQQQSCHNNNNPISRQSDSISQSTKGPKHSNPVNNVLQCYGCGLNDREATQGQPFVIANNTRGTLSAHRNRDSNTTNHRRLPEELRKISSERNRFLYPAGLPGNVPVRVRKCPVGSDFFLKDQSSTSGIPSTSSFSSIASFADDMRWEATPRFPPSLGRPRRKLYAGFDSQPLPMDSYISDSSSVFSIQSCGSWGASRSAEVESSSRFQDVAPSIRSVSSIAYGSSRSLSDNDDAYFLTDSKNINFYNLYPHFSNSVIEDCLKDSFHGKNFSRESLESFLSDATTIGENPDYKSDITKLNTDYDPHNDLQDKNAPIVHSEQITNEKSQRDKFNSGSVPGSVGCKLNGGNLEDNKRLQEIPKISSCSTANIPRSIRKGKYLSSKDILDLILTPDKTSKKETATLERQAQKMYEVILCCNEVEFQPAKEYHF